MSADMWSVSVPCLHRTKKSLSVSVACLLFEKIVMSVHVTSMFVSMSVSVSQIVCVADCLCLLNSDDSGQKSTSCVRYTR